MYYHGHEAPTKTDIANYWHDSHASELDGAAGDALTDAAVFFTRVVGLARLGKFVPAGKGRDTHIQIDRPALESYIGEEPVPDEQQQQQQQQQIPPPPPQFSVGTGLNVRVEIHIAADAKPATIEEIFKNMRKYLIERPNAANGD